MVKIKSKYKALYTTKKRYTLVTGGRGSGKTFAVQDFAVRLLEQVGQGILYTRYTMSSVEKTIIPLFVKHIELIGDIRNYHITKTQITNKRTGAFLMFSGIKTSSGDQTANLKTLPNITTWIIEEGEDFNKEQSFVDIDDSIRSKHLPNRIIWIQNPTTREHFIYQRFFEHSYESINIEEAGTYVDEDGKLKPFTYQRSTHPDVEHIHTTYYDNEENLDEGKIRQWEGIKIKKPKKWLNKYGGAWLDKAEGVIFEDWEEGDFDHSLPYGYGQDYGFSVDPTTLIKVAIDTKRKRVYLHEEFYSTTLNGKQMGTEDIYDINFNRIYSGNDLIVADAQEGRTILDLKRMGLNIKECIKGPGSVKAGILSLQDYTFVVTPSSSNIKKEFNNYRWNDKKAGIPIDDHNHAMDAIRYIFKHLLTGGNPYILL
jgi:phage terminase large subunit